MIVYKDINQFYSDKDTTAVVVNVEDVFQSIQTILETPKYTRAHLPEFGVDLYKYLFQLNTTETKFLILDEIVNAINRWEPRVIVSFKDSSVDWVDYDNHILRIDIVFKIKDLSEKTYDFTHVLNLKNK